MPREKIRRTEKTVNVDMKIVKKLTDLRDSINQQAKQTGLFCNLFPDLNKKVCKQCSEKNCKLCLEHEREREFIHKQEATKGNKRRERKQNNPKHKDDGDISVDMTDEEDFEEGTYICGEMYFACPNKDDCNFGNKCIYLNDTD